MVTATVQGTEAVGHVSNLIPDEVANATASAIGSREEIEAELDIYMAKLRDCWSMQPDQAMLTCSAISARLSELAVQLHRVEHRRSHKQLRTLQVQVILGEVDRQMRIASRLLEVKKIDLALQG